MTAGADPDLPEEVRVDAPAVVDEDGQAVDGGPAEPDVEALGGDDPAAALDALRGELAERTGDLQRLQADYANYRRRVEREREQAKEEGSVTVLSELLPVLDDLDRAREHGDLTGAFKAVGESLEGSVARLGLERFGAVGDPFDPAVHEAISHTHSADVTETTCVGVLQPGYRFGERVVRPARVAVADPDTEGVD